MLGTKELDDEKTLGFSDVFPDESSRISVLVILQAVAVRLFTLDSRNLCVAKSSPTAIYQRRDFRVDESKQICITEISVMPTQLARLLPTLIASVFAVSMQLFCTESIIADGADHRVFDQGQQPEDSRLKPAKDLNGYFPFEVPKSKAAWEQRQTELKQRVQIATGLWPMPEKTPLNAVIHGKVERDGFTVEKVYFESLPGHFVSGLLFRPAGATDQKRPAILSPHGHGGRNQDYGEANMAKLIESGAEIHERSGRFPKIARCAQLARMGCVTFIFDMLGYVDSNQVSFQVAHRYADRRPEMESGDGWGFYSPQAESRLHSIMGLQTWKLRPSTRLPGRSAGC